MHYFSVVLPTEDADDEFSFPSSQPAESNLMLSAHYESVIQEDSIQFMQSNGVLTSTPYPTTRNEAEPEEDDDDDDFLNVEQFYNRHNL